jgi:hypothetical protein
MRKTIVLISAALLWLGVAGAEASGGDDVVFEEIFFGDFGHFYDGPTDLVIRNERQWCEFWKQAHGIRVEPPPCDLTLVDFRHEVVIASSIRGSNGCVGIGIANIESGRRHRRGLGRRRGGLRVFVRDIVPGRNCICTQSFVFRVRAVVVSKPVGRVSFIHETAITQCERIVIDLHR